MLFTFVSVDLQALVHDLISKHSNWPQWSDPKYVENLAIQSQRSMIDVRSNKPFHLSRFFQSIEDNICVFFSSITDSCSPRC